MKLSDYLAGLLSWKTTVVGAILAGLKAYQDGAFADPTDVMKWLIPVAIAVFGFIARDANKTSEDSDLK